MLLRITAGLIAAGYILVLLGAIDLRYRYNPALRGRRVILYLLIVIALPWIFFYGGVFTDVVGFTGIWRTISRIAHFTSIAGLLGILFVMREYVKHNVC
ncbi:MAG: hypothetical protein KJO36_08320 [Acidimicrobiia bacterium]|nr:hypothetical protein [Acidimicrobiia bacterium]